MERIRRRGSRGLRADQGRVLARTLFPSPAIDVRAVIGSPGPALGVTTSRIAPDSLTLQSPKPVDDAKGLDGLFSTRLSSQQPSPGADQGLRARAPGQSKKQPDARLPGLLGSPWPGSTASLGAWHVAAPRHLLPKPYIQCTIRLLFWFKFWLEVGLRLDS